jgi:DNA-binding MurR/RpiR family transcriptional regulator
MAVPEAHDSDVTVAERLHLKLAELTPAERKVARALLAEYPVRGLQPVAKLAATAGVSAPTVIRLVSKLSFDSYAGFQLSLKSEVLARLSSPLTVHAGRSAERHDGDVLSKAEQVFCEGI